jgi:prepilin-type processing-associated H-X9-DG protein
MPGVSSSQANSKSAISAFTFTDLLVLITVTVILALVLMPTLLSVKEPYLLAACTNNLKQIGVGCSVYASENSDTLPTIGLFSTANAYQASLACRVAGIPSTQITIGPFGLGQLYFYAGVNDPRVFYCPAVQTGLYAFSTYSAPGYPWPAMTPADLPPATDGNPFVRTGYTYYPQSRILTQVVALPGGTLTIPACNFVDMNFNPPNPPGGTPNSGAYPAPLTMTQVNLKKAMAVDAMTIWASINHQYRGQPYGLNALFPDGHVRLQTVSGNNKKNSYAPFDRSDLWDPTILQGPAETAYSSTLPAFRIIMNGFQP